MEDKQKPYTKYKSSRLGSRGKPIKGKGPGRPEGGPAGADVPGGPAGTGGAGPGGPGGRVPSDGLAPPASAPAAAREPRSRGKIILWTVLIFLLVLLIAALVSYIRLDLAVRASNGRVPDDVEPVLTVPASSIRSGPVNILFLGSDQRPDEPARADTILLMRVNGKKKSIAQLSIPRDTLVDIPGYGEGKINSAYAYGGPALMIETVEQFTGVPINHYVEINFDGFPEIVDAVGGVDINVPTAIDSQYPVGYDWTDVHFDAGPQHMDGDRALVYVRVRYSDDDFQRMARQQQFMEALQKRFTSPLNALRLPLTAPGMIGAITTDLSTSDLLSLGWVKVRTSPQNSRKFVLAGSGADIGGVSYVVVDDSGAQAQIQDFLAT